MPRSAPPESELVLLVQKHRGKPAEKVYLNLLLERYQERIARWCLQVLGNVDDASDAMQETLVHVCNGLTGFRGDCHVDTWIYSIARSTCLRALNKRRQRSSRETELQRTELEIPGTVPPPSETLETQEAQTLFQAVFARAITPREAEAMVLHHVEGLSLNTITQRLRLMNPSGAKALLVNAKRKLRHFLAPERLRQIGLDPPATSSPTAGGGEGGEGGA